MTTNYGRYTSTRKTPQSEAIPGTAKVKNSAGGFAWAITPWQRLTRFLILGAEGGTYYATERDLTKQNASCILECADLDPMRTATLIADVSSMGRAPKNDPAIYALSLMAGHSAASRRAALGVLSRVCRTGTHLFQFVEWAQQRRGWGRGLRQAIGRWYLNKDVDDLQYQLVKYRQRNGWTHRDLLRLAHPIPRTAEQQAVLAWAAGKPNAEATPEFIREFEAVQAATGPSAAAAIIRRAKLPREAVPTEFLKDRSVWMALLDEPMKPHALIRNLGVMTANGTLKAGIAPTGQVLARLADHAALVKARVHPIACLAALLTYQSGKGMRGSLTWTPITPIVDALDAAFYGTFGAVASTGKRLLLAIDVSGSMDGGTIAGVPGLTPRIGAAAMALVTQAREPNVTMVGFSADPAASRRGAYGGQWGGTTSLTPLTISARQRMDDVVKAMRAIPMGGTDCALPMLYAVQQKLPIDTFVIYTDNETWAGAIHPVQALRDYRAAMGINAKLVVVGMTATEFSIADPQDIGMLDVVGFDTATPNLITQFVGEGA